MKSSPVFSRVARVHGNDRIYISGLFSQKKRNGEAEVRAVFDELKHILKKMDSDLKHLAKATYYVASDEASKELNRLRPEYYDPLRPPAASKAAVSDTGIAERKLTLDMIAAPLPR
jgi:enamine deaminase RidA (YjgF/YER057c/UK114 family)